MASGTELRPRRAALAALLAHLLACAASPSSPSPSPSLSSSSAPAASSSAPAASSSSSPSPSGSASSAPALASSPPVEPPAAPARRVYPRGARHAPYTPSMVAWMRGELARSGGRPDVFAKVGDSITVSGAFLACLDGKDVRWGEHERLQEAHRFFSKTRADEQRSSFSRETKAARVSWKTGRVLKGKKPPLLVELDEIRPAFAVVMLGTNDTFPDAMQGYYRSLHEVLGVLESRHVVPLLSTIPPRRDSLRAAEQTTEMNEVLRAVAQERGLPLMDLFGALDPLKGAGLNRDGVHPEGHLDGGYHPCWFDKAGLGAGMNQRNLLVLEALDLARRKVLGDEAPDAELAPVAGEGTWKEPFEVAGVPASFDGDTRGGPSEAARYGCGKEELGGPERVYRVNIEKAGRLRVRLFNGAGAGAAIRWLSGPDPGRCEAKAQTRLDVQVKPGVHWLVVDAPSAARAGHFAVTLVPIAPPGG